MIELTDVSVTYRRRASERGKPGGGAGTASDNEVAALCGINLRIAKGEWAFLVGPTGAGKSTLLKLLYRDVHATQGMVRIGGRDVTNLPARDVPHLRRLMGIALQDYGLLPERTVRENVAFACEVLGQGRREIRRKLPEALELVGMAHRCDAFPRELSGGEQQRVALARALVNQPPLLLADEPTGNLDPQTSEGIMDVLLEANRRGATVVVVTHDQASVDRLHRRVIALGGGRIVRDEWRGGYDVRDAASGETDDAMQAAGSPR